MKTVKSTCKDMPEMIPVPESIVHKKGEVIFIIDDDEKKSNGKAIKDFFGSIPDLPERCFHGNYEERESL